MAIPSADCYHLGQLILDNLAQNPDEIAQIDARTGVSETRGSLRARGITVARNLSKFVHEKDIVTICAYNHENTCLPLIGALCLGVCASGLDMRMSKMEYEHVLNITQPKLLFCEPSIAEVFYEIVQDTGANTKIVVFGESRNKNWMSFSEFLVEEKNPPPFKVTPIDPDKTLSYILTSSGSTGLPKGVCHSHKRLYQHVLGVKKSFDGMTMLQFSSIYWLSGIGMTLINLLTRTVRVNAAPFVAENFFEYVPKYSVNLVMVTPAVVRMMLNNPGLKQADLSSLKILMVAGATVDFDELAQMQTCVPNGQVINSYGLSEIGGPVTYTVGDVRRGACGKIIPFIEHKITDVLTGDKITEPNKEGELHLRAPCMMKGYYRNPEETALAVDHEGWFHTGDLVKMDEDGYLYIVDRLKEVFKYMGYGIAPATIEGVIVNHPGVMEAVVVGLDNKDTGHVPLAVVQRTSNSTVTAQEIKDLVKSQLAFYCELRAGVAFVDHFEMTPSGKVKRNAIRKNVASLNIECAEVKI